VFKTVAKAAQPCAPQSEMITSQPIMFWANELILPCPVMEKTKIVVTLEFNLGRGQTLIYANQKQKFAFIRVNQRPFCFLINKLTLEGLVSE
jgi:hypothetical protein